MAQTNILYELGMNEITSTNKEIVISEEGKKVLFFWGNNCPNCDETKKIIKEHLPEYEKLNIKWYHANLYNDFELAHYFGVHGIPVFFLYTNEKKIGRITSFPGHDIFIDLLQKF